MDDKAAYLQPDENANNHLINNAETNYGHITVIGGGIVVTGNMDVGPGAMVAGRDIIINNYPPFSFDPSPESPNFIDRPEMLDQLRQAVLENNGPPVALTALHGMGGIGKTALTAALCHDDEIKNHFSGGIIWVTVGREPRDLENKIQQAKLQIRGKLNESKSVLLVIDDVWDISHIQPFLFGSPLCHTLFTTRDVSIVTSLGAREIKLGVMTPDQATKLLRKWAEKDDPAFLQIAQRLGFLPLALQLAGAIMKAENWSGHEWLEEFRRISDIRLGHYSDKPSDSLMVSLDLSVQVLPESDHFLYYSLGIFPEEAWVPRTVAVRLWQEHRLDLRELDCKRLVVELSKRSMLEWDDKSDRFTMHDMLREYTREQLGDRWIATHQTLLKTYNPEARPWAEIEEDGYLTDHLVHHLEQAEQYDDIHALFRTEGWAKKRPALGLLGDFERARQFVEPDDIETHIRYVLFADVVRQPYRDLPVEALPTAIKGVLADPNTLMVAIREMSGGAEAKLRAYLDAAVNISPRLRERYADEILDIARGILLESSQEKLALNFELLMKLMAFLPQPLRSDAQRIAWQVAFKVEGVKARNKLLDSLLTIPKEQLTVLKNDILTIENLYMRTDIMVRMESLFAEGVQYEIWKMILDDVFRVHHPYSRGQILGHLIPYLPPRLQEKASDKIWKTLSAIEYWESFEFFEEILGPLVPYIPTNDVCTVWERAKYELDTHDHDWGELCLETIALHVPIQVLPTEFRFDDGIEIKVRETTKSAINIAMIHRQPSNQRQEIGLYSWQTLLSDSTMGRHESNLPQAVSKLPQAIMRDIWNVTLETEFDESTIKSLYALARYLPVDFILQACIDCIKHRNKLRKDSWAELIRILVARLCDERQLSAHGHIRIWCKIIAILLDQPLEHDPKKIKDAFVLVRYIPTEFRDEFLRVVLSSARSIPDLATRAYILASTLESLPAELQAEVWLEAWNTLLESSNEDKAYRVEQIVDQFQFIEDKLTPEQHLTLRTANWEAPILKASLESWSGSSLRFYGTGIGLALLLNFAPQEFINSVWNCFQRNSSFYPYRGEVYTLIAFFPFISAEEQNRALPYILPHCPTSEKDIVIIKRIIKYWSDEFVWRAWRCFATIDENYSGYVGAYGEWALTLLPYLPDEYIIQAWEMALKNVTPSFWILWPEICTQLSARLPTEFLPEAWRRVEVIEQEHGGHWIFGHDIKTAMASRLPSNFLLSLAQLNDSQLLSSNIFTCSLHKYIRHYWATSWGRCPITSSASEDISCLKYASIHLSVLVSYLAYPTISLAYISIMIWRFVQFIARPYIYVSRKARIIYRICKSEIHSASYSEEDETKINFYFSRVLILILMIFAFILHAPTWITYRIIYFLFLVIEKMMKKSSLETPFLILFTATDIAGKYRLTKSQAETELKKANSLAELVSIRPFIQRVGGSKLREATADAYEHSVTWWREAVSRVPPTNLLNDGQGR
ncbi:MAG: hypothetical protein JW725_05275 [Candidatus Babeliaceae bacterium]|nr:hypothetical protein [Candidatus Babeliaceae bacterium]